MANPEVVTQRLLIKGVVAEAGLTEAVADFQAQFTAILTQAKETGAEEYAAATLALTLAGLDLAEEAGV
ncbi:hypothetical protein bas27_0100 [Escherichia phage TrudiGerster]|uniref:Uncharacterized protein n=1 Tax=Escherichia phage TrudiGerster TaxID=2851991 RepID=A0AAE8B3X5_9CAUD|nr:hypothetical protein bas27_0100 [Escherichia phage TrudiGerster]